MKSGRMIIADGCRLLDDIPYGGIVGVFHVKRTVLIGLFDGSGTDRRALFDTSRSASCRRVHGTCRPLR